MHDGSIATLEDVVEFYAKGGVQNPYQDPRVRLLDLTATEKRQLVAFLRALSGRITEGLK
jgi:cytochrome c peroxidase